MEEEVHFSCPHCWQTIGVMLDLSVGGQRYIQDCEVCCNPFEIEYEVSEGTVSRFEVSDIEQ